MTSPYLQRPLRSLEQAQRDLAEKQLDWCDRKWPGWRRATVQRVGEGEGKSDA